MANCVNCDQFKELDEFIDALPSKKGELIRVLHHAQKTYGYLPQELQIHIARKMGVPTSKVFGVVSFYSFFTMEPKGEFDISICLGTACYVRGADKVLEEFKQELGIDVGGTTPDGKFSLSVLRCVGACGLAPVVLVNGKVYGRVAAAEVKGILDEYREV
ncbi:NAD(P)H-dependent oxidoreductase subunit E [Lachnospiraceae bacterium oral taxon 500]|nr:NAD(P)H-dependent oxidoreductase subunit E [Lachnospiraceae bacterium oral taxon 500]